VNRRRRARNRTLLNNLSVRLADLGQREEATAAHEEAGAFMRLFDHSGDELLTHPDGHRDI
jgi:hypothetical protein